MKKLKASVLALVLVIMVTFHQGARLSYGMESEPDVLDFMLEKEEERIVYLTFDDGPSIYTEALLDVLAAYDVPAIFFVLGQSMNYHPEADRILNRIVEEGHFIGLHTMTHNKNTLYWESLSPQQFVDEMFELKEEVENRTGHQTNLCRAPYGKRGHFKPAHFHATQNAGLYCIDWHVDSQDWAKQNASQIYDEVLQGIQNLTLDQSEIVLLFHEYGRTATALPLILDYLIGEGYRFEPYVEGHRFEGLE